jgi:hypothetical protein
LQRRGQHIWPKIGTFTLGSINFLGTLERVAEAGVVTWNIIVASTTEIRTASVSEKGGFVAHLERDL